MQRHSLSDLRTIIRDQADMPNTSFVTDARLTTWINAAIGELHDLLILSFEDYFAAKKTYDCAESIQVPDDFYKVLKVFWIDAGTRTAIRSFNLENMGIGDNDYWPRISNSSLQYRLLGNRIYFEPDNASGEIELWYIPQPEKLTNDEDEISYAIPVGWDEFIIADVCARCLAKEESDPSFFLARKQEISARVRSAAPQRDTGDGWRINDISNRFGWGWDD